MSSPFVWFDEKLYRMHLWTAFRAPTNISPQNAESKQLGVGVRMLTKKSDGCHAERSVRRHEVLRWRPLR
jgi:hypothetical protein